MIFSSSSCDAALLRRRSFFSLVLVLVVGGLVSGCGSLSNLGSSVSPKKLKRLDQVAVVSIAAGDNIGTKDLDRNRGAADSRGDAVGSLGEAAERAKSDMQRSKKRATPDYKPAMNRVHEYVFGELAGVLPFEFIDENKVLESSDYQNFQPKEVKGPVGAMVDKPEDIYVSPKNYRFAPPSILQRRSGKRGELFDLLPSETDAILAVEVRYKVGKASTEAKEQGAPQQLSWSEGDDVTAQVQAEVKTQVLTPKGTLVMDVTQKGWSGDSFTFTFGEGWDAEEVNDLAMKATDKALQSTMSYLEKQLSSSK